MPADSRMLQQLVRTKSGSDRWDNNFLTWRARLVALVEAVFAGYALHIRCSFPRSNLRGRATTATVADIVCVLNSTAKNIFPQQYFISTFFLKLSLGNIARRKKRFHIRGFHQFRYE